MSAVTELSPKTMLQVTLTASLVSLLLSSWTFAMSLDDDDYERSIEERLACLELPGPNDCGVDGD